MKIIRIKNDIERYGASRPVRHEQREMSERRTNTINLNNWMERKNVDSQSMRHILSPDSIRCSRRQTNTADNDEDDASNVSTRLKNLIQFKARTLSAAPSIDSFGCIVASLCAQMHHFDRSVLLPTHLQ